MNVIEIFFAVIYSQSALPALAFTPIPASHRCEEVHATEAKFDSKSFSRLKRTIQQMSQGRQGCLRDPAFATPLPVEIGLQLTNRCNLRCQHCFQWNETGWHRKLTSAQRSLNLDFDLIAKIIHQTAAAKPNLYLWGGEPLSYPDWEPLARLLEKNPRWAVLCTNGIDLDPRMKIIGDLHHEEVADLWNKPEFRRTREVLHRGRHRYVPDVYCFTYMEVSSRPAIIL